MTAEQVALILPRLADLRAAQARLQHAPSADDRRERVALLAAEQAYREALDDEAVAALVTAWTRVGALEEGLRQALGAFDAIQVVAADLPMAKRYAATGATEARAILAGPS